MKKTVQVLLAAAAVVALAVPAMAADKLIVKNAGGTANVFTVDDAGLVTAAKMGVGTTSPFTQLHLHASTAAVGTALYASNAAFTGSNQNTSVLSDYVVADGTATAGFRGAIRGVRSRGSLVTPTVPLVNDLVFSVLGGIWDGAAVQNTADIVFAVDGTVSAGIAPQRIAFRTRPGGAGVLTERLKIMNDGKIILDVVNMPVFADNTAAASLTAGTLYRTATGAVMIKF